MHTAAQVSRQGLHTAQTIGRPQEEAMLLVWPARLAGISMHDRKVASDTYLLGSLPSSVKYAMVIGTSDSAHGDNEVSSPAPYRIAPLTGVGWVSCSYMGRCEEEHVT
eukprot:55743-Eustigmatos_ZCMA.PRE.1